MNDQKERKKKNNCPQVDDISPIPTALTADTYFFWPSRRGQQQSSGQLIAWLSLMSTMCIKFILWQIFFVLMLLIHRSFLLLLLLEAIIATKKPSTTVEINCLQETKTAEEVQGAQCQTDKLAQKKYIPKISKAKPSCSIDMQALYHRMDNIKTGQWCWYSKCAAPPPIIILNKDK